jgi:AraC-like DNA-binding protein
LPAKILFSSPALDGAPLEVRQYRLDPDGAAELPAGSRHAAFLLMGGPCEPGLVGILPAGTAGTWRRTRARSCLRLYLRAGWLEGILRSERQVDPETVTLRRRFAWRDPFIWVFGAGLLRRARLGGAMDRTMLDSAALGLACHLLREHSATRHPPSARVTDEGLRVGAFIDDAIATELGLDDLADAIGVCRAELARGFGLAHTPSLWRCLRHERILRARELLGHSDMTGVDLARAAGFASADALDVALCFAVGSSLAEYRLDP